MVYWRRFVDWGRGGPARQVDSRDWGTPSVTCPRWRVVNGTIALLLVIHASLLAWMGWRMSPAMDEPGHLVAGLSYWQSGGFSLYRVNPPLIRLLAAIPLLSHDLRPDWALYTNDPYARPEFSIGAGLADDEGLQTFWCFTLARWACIPFSIIGGWTCFRWANELYGTTAGIAALTLWCFCPNILGNGALITPDAGAAAMGVTACYCFWRWRRQPSWKRAVIAGLTLGLAELTKSTWIILWGLWPVLWLAGKLTSNPPENVTPLPEGAVQTELRGLDFDAARRSLRFNISALVIRHSTGFLQLSSVLVVGLYILNLGYLFENSFQRLDKFQFISRALGGRDAHTTPGNRFAGGWFAMLPVPVPANYLSGIDVQRYDFEKENWSYLRGEQKKGGWWYYYLYAMAVKVPTGTLLLFGMTLAQCILRSVRSARDTQFVSTSRFGNPNPLCSTSLSPCPLWLDGLTFLAPAILVLILVSSQTGFNRYLRYVLPVFPFLFIWCSQIVTLSPPRKSESQVGGGFVKASLLQFLPLLALSATIASSLAVYPHSLSYFNEFAGGPANGPAHLLDANIDWGQDLLELKRWHDAHPDSHPLLLTYFGIINPRTAGLECRPVTLACPPRNDRNSEKLADDGLKPGWYAISVNHLYNYKHYGHEEDCYEYLRSMRPAARAGYSIWIYHVGVDDLRHLQHYFSSQNPH